jgi:hypothetical protein
VDKKPRTTWACGLWEQWTQNSPELMVAGVMSPPPLAYQLQHFRHPEKQKALIDHFSKINKGHYSLMQTLSMKEWSYFRFRYLLNVSRDYKKQIAIYK